MKLAINALSALRGGGQTYLKNLLKEYGSSDFNHHIILFVGKKNKTVFESFESDKVSVVVSNFASRNIIFRTLWEVFYIPVYLRRKEIDSYYAPGGLMLTKSISHCKMYTALRNMLPFDKNERKRFPFLSYVRFKLFTLKWLYFISYKLSDGVVFISHYSRNVVAEQLPSVLEKSTLIYHGINPLFKERSNEELTAPNVQEYKYYLYVSILDVYKAQKEIVNYWINLHKDKLVTEPLVLVGPVYNNYGRDLIGYIESVCKNNEVIYLGQVEYDKLPKFYQSAKALIFGSSCECCPNILLEKLASKRPVICSNIQPMPEFAGHSALLFDPYNEDSFREAVCKLESQDLFKQLSLLSEKRANDFCWKQTATDTFSYLFRTKV
ncbi:glycosyltransferase family 4 protein [Vibrio sp. 1731]|uniref:glycosyltransferase family 4 protein n=1 Tax=Vibrio sp. 1731 TaxID=3074573 RepID=UPI0021CEAF24|nr:glycosyltransferase family 4 protein [Vibrio sp. 1731]MDW2113367.1 glycosyltransferase family 4 protein [Vibrio sp. 1731]